MQQPLKGLRIAATIPPSTWFGGVDYSFAMDMQQELTLLGAHVCAIPVDPFVRGKDIQIQDGVSALQSFRPDVAVSLANAGYVLLCNTLDGKNIFRDILQIPTVMLWDHGPLQFSRTILGKPPVAPSESSRGCIGRLREALDHPLFTHYSPDRGHIAAFHDLGILDADKVRFFLQPAYPSYVRHGHKANANPAVKQQVTFAGNVYIEGSRKLTFGIHSTLGEIQAKVFAMKKDRLTASLWDLLLAEIGNLDSGVAESLQLEPDSSFFWSFAHDVIEIAGNTDVRLAVLTSLKRDLQFYGNFVEPDARSVLRRRYGIRCRASLHCVTELPRLYGGSAITVDVINSGYNTGSSPKITACLAAGGMPLFDYKPDFHDSMGDAGQHVMYHSIDELNARIDHYLTNPAQRLEVIRELQERVRERFTFGALMTKILVDEPLWRQC